MGFNYFFDNTEFSGSSYANDQTMKGLHVTPQMTFQWENIHSFFVGTDLLNISGSKKAVEKVELIAYYQLFMCFVSNLIQNVSIKILIHKIL